MTHIGAFSGCPVKSRAIGNFISDMDNLATNLKAVTTAFSDKDFWLDIKRSGKSCGSIGLTSFMFDSSVNRYYY